MEVILGSSSKWRQEVAKKTLGCPITLMPANIDERAVAAKLMNPKPSEHTMTIARAKLDHLLSVVKSPNCIIMCFDTIVVFDGLILEKPNDSADLMRMINMWNKAGSRISVLTSVEIAQKPSGSRIENIERADIVMNRALSEEEIKHYIEKSGCSASSGAVVVENLIEVNAATVEGDITVIEGFPVSFVRQTLHCMVPGRF